MANALVYYGYNPPFFGGHQNVMSRQSGDRLIKNDLIQLIMTMKGERVMRPTWGTNLHKQVFEQINGVMLEQISEDIREAILQFEPRVQVAVNATANEDENAVDITVQGFYTDRPNDTLEVELSIPLTRDK